jgi:hypothetical protein
MEHWWNDADEENPRSKRRTCPSSEQSGTATGFHPSELFGGFPITFLPPFLHAHISLIYHQRCMNSAVESVVK